MSSPFFLELLPEHLDTLGPEVRRIDVREPDEFEGPRGHLPRAELVPLGTLEAACATWPREAPLLLICRSGRRSVTAAETSLLVIAFNSFVGFAGYLGHVNVAWGALTLFTALAIAGTVGGTWLSRFISQATLKRAFAGLLVVMGVLILYENRRTLPSLGRAAAMDAPRPARPG